MEEERQREKKVRQGRQLEKRNVNRANKQGWAKGGMRVIGRYREASTHTCAHTYPCTEHKAAGECKAVSCGKELSGDIKQKDKTERSNMTTPSRTGSVVLPGN